MAVVTVEKALQLWDEALQTQVHKVETIAVKAAKGYVLAEDIIAPTDVPAFYGQGGGRLRKKRPGRNRCENPYARHRHLPESKG